MIDLFSAPFSSIGNDQLYSAVVDFARAQP